MSLPRFSIHQAVLVNVLFVVFLLAGYTAFTRTPVDYFPDISFNATNITTIWTGASADEVERLITTKLEEEIQDVSGIKELRSWSTADSSRITISWDEGLSDIDYESGLNDVRAAIDRVGDLPSDAEEPIVRELSVAELYAVMLVAIVDKEGVGETALLEVARDAKSRIENIFGVHKVIIRGEHDREIQILVDRDTAARHGLSVVEIADRIRRKNLNLPAGSFSGASGESVLRATGDYESVEEILSTVVSDDRGGTNLRVRDIARVEMGLEKRSFYGRYNGENALLLSIAKDPDANLLELSVDVRSWVEEYREVVPDGVEPYVSWDSADYVSSRIRVIWNNILTGIFFVMAILWFTIGFRNAALTIIAVPFSFLSALILFQLLDITINMISLVGMLLVSGMLVDDAIIVLENIYRRVETGEPFEEAIINGAEEVLWPVVAAVLTTCAAFSPLLFMTGTSGEFMSILPKTVIVCLLASLMECLIILPAHYLDFGSRHAARDVDVDQEPQTGWLGTWQRWTGFFERAHFLTDRGLDWLRARYLIALDKVLEYPGSFAVLSISVFYLAMNAAGHIPVDLFASEYSRFFIVVETPLDYSLDETDAVVRKLEAAMNAELLPDPLLDFSTYVGHSISGNDDQRVGSNLAVIYNWIIDKPAYRADPDPVLDDVRGWLRDYKKAHPEGLVNLEAKAPRNGPPIGKPVAVRIQTDDYLLAKQISREMQDFLGKLPGIRNIEDSLKTGAREVRLIINDERAGQYGVSFEDLAKSLRGANDGVVASSFRGPDESQEIDIRVMLDESFRRDISDLLRTKTRTPDGHLIELGDVAEVEVTRGFQSLTHFDAKRTVTVYADVDADITNSILVNDALRAEFANLDARYADVEIYYGGEFEVTKRTNREIGQLMPIALLLVYMILAALFRSYWQPLIVVTAVPYGIIGVIAGVGIFGYAMSMAIFYATIGLIGVVVNDSLVMVDFINRARASGLPLYEAVRQSGAMRLRPILLTTLTTVVALLPMAMGVMGGSKSQGPFAAAIAFGLMVAMIGTLFIVPLSYIQMLRFIDYAKALMQRLRARIVTNVSG